MKNGFGFLGIIIFAAVILSVAFGGGFYWNETKKQQSLFETGADAIKRTEELKKQIESRQEQIYGGRTSINIEQIRNASFDSAFFKKVVTLRAGLYSEKPITNSAIVATAQIYDDKIAFGDIDGDGISDALAVVIEYGGGSGSFRSLVAFENDGGTPLYIARADLGDRTIINSIKIESGIVVLDMIVQGPNDGMCCPTLHERRSYQLVGNQLKEVIDIDTSTWKTYRNEKYGFEFKYPPHFTIVERGIHLSEEFVEVVGIGWGEKNISEIRVINRTKFATITDYNWPRNICGQQTISDIIREIITSEDKITIAGYKTLYVVSSYGGDMKGYYYCINYPSNPIIFYFYSGSKENKDAREILSTFKFVN